MLGKYTSIKKPKTERSIQETLNEINAKLDKLIAKDEVVHKTLDEKITETPVEE